MSKRDEFVEKLKGQIDSVNSDIDELERKAESVKNDARAKYLEELENAKSQRAELEAKVTQIKQSGEDAWEGLQDEVEHAWKALNNSINYFKSHFK